MKRALSIFLLIVMIFTFTSCSQEHDKDVDKSNELSIVTTIFPYYDFARSIVGDRGNVKLLLSPGAEPHSFEPSPSDIVDIENCDLFIYNGGESDEWIENVLASIENKSVISIKMMDYIDLLCEDEFEYTDSAYSDHNEEDGEHEHHHEHNHEHGGYDEHIWTSIDNAKSIISVIFDKICEIDVINKDYYNSNLQSYSQDLNSLDSKFKDLMRKANKDTVVFGDRFPLLYFVTEYGIDYECAFPGCSSETEPSIEKLTYLIDFVRTENIPVVFYLDFSSGNIAKLISEDTDAKVEVFYSCHNVTKEQFNNGENYISLMEHNYSVLKEALM